MTPLHWKCFNELLAYNVPPPNYERGGEGEKKIKSDSNARAQIPCAPVADREDAAMEGKRENKKAGGYLGTCLIINEDAKK